MGFRAIGLLLLALAGCWDDCAGFYDENTHRCYEPAGGGEPGPSEAPKRPGRLLAVDLETRDVIPIRDEIFGSGLMLDQPVAIELTPDGTVAYVADGARILSVRVDDGETRLVSGDGRGSGILFDAPVGLEWDEGLLVVHDAGRPLAILVDVATGDRSESLLPFAPGSVEEERRIIDTLEGLEYIVFRGG